MPAAGIIPGAGIPGGGVPGIPGAAIIGAGIPGGGVPGIPEEAIIGLGIPGGGVPGIPEEAIIPGAGAGIPGPIAGAGIPAIPGPGMPGLGAPPPAASSRACEPGIRRSLSHAAQCIVCFLLIGNSGIQNSVNFVVNLRITCSDALPHWPHTNCSTASTRMYVFQP